MKVRRSISESGMANSTLEAEALAGPSGGRSVRGAGHAELIEMEGIPHLDRFLLKLRVRYPAIEELTGSTSSSSRGRFLFSPSVSLGVL